MSSPYTLSPTTKYLALGHHLPLCPPTSKTKPSTSMQLIRMSNLAPFIQPYNELPYPSACHSFPSFAQLLKTEMVPESVVILAQAHTGEQTQEQIPLLYSSSISSKPIPPLHTGEVLVPKVSWLAHISRQLPLDPPIHFTRIPNTLIQRFKTFFRTY